MTRRLLGLATAGTAAVLACSLAPLPAFAAGAGPSIAFVDPADGAVVSGTTEVQVSLEDDDLKSYNLRVDSAGLDYAYQAVNGVRAFVWDTRGLADGAHVLLATATDAEGNKTTERRTVFVDNVAPVLSSSIAEGASVRGVTDIVLAVDEATPQAFHAQLYTAAGAAVDTVKGYRWQPDTGRLVLEGVDTRKLADGGYVLRFTAKSDGGLTTTLAVRFTIDNTRPGLTIDSPAVGAAFKPGVPVSVALSATDAAGLKRVAVNLYDAANATLLDNVGATSNQTPIGDSSWTGGFAVPSGLGEGVYTLRASVTDLAGNSTTTTRTLTIDATRPELSVETRPLADGSVEVVLTAGDAGLLGRLVSNLYDGANAKLLKNLGSTPAAPAIGLAAATATFTVPAGFAPGEYTVRSSATDAAGNIRTVSVPLTIAAPVVEAPVDETPVVEAPADDAADEPASIEDAPAAEAPSEDAPEQDAPVEDAPADAVEDEVAPVEVPVGTAPGETPLDGASDSDELGGAPESAGTLEDASGDAASQQLGASDDSRPTPRASAAPSAVASAASAGTSLAQTGVDVGAVGGIALGALVLGALGALFGLRRARRNAA